jgi:hypothetical protein
VACRKIWSTIPHETVLGMKPIRQSGTLDLNIPRTCLAVEANSRPLHLTTKTDTSTVQASIQLITLYLCTNSKRRVDSAREQTCRWITPVRITYYNIKMLRCHLCLNGHSNGGANGRGVRQAILRGIGVMAMGDHCWNMRKSHVGIGRGCFRITRWRCTVSTYSI